MNIYFIILILLQFMGLGIDLARYSRNSKDYKTDL